MSQLVSTNPYSNEVIWEGPMADAEAVRVAVSQAREAYGSWSTMPLAQRIAICEKFAAFATEAVDEIAELIADESGKALWDAKGEAGILASKVGVSIEAMQELTGDRPVALPQGQGTTLYRSIGVVAVLGPFNFPVHLANGQIVAALLAGNTVVYKPSEQTPATGERYAKLWADAGLPDGVLNVVQGARETGQALVEADVNAVLFTGSYAAGRAIHRALAGRPEVLLALEMGGNNPMIVSHSDSHSDSDSLDTDFIQAAAHAVFMSAYPGSGQRCNCARRLVLPKTNGDLNAALIDEIKSLISRIHYDAPKAEPQPFYGTLINADAGRAVMQGYEAWLSKGAKPIVAMSSVNEHPAMLTPGLIDVTDIPAADRPDEELFGPLLQVIYVDDFEVALVEANATNYGLAASLLSQDAEQIALFKQRIHAGIVNINTTTTGASAKLPFGGLGHSGNHRPAGYHNAQSVAHAIGMIEVPELKVSAALPTGVKG